MSVVCPGIQGRKDLGLLMAHYPRQNACCHWDLSDCKDLVAGLERRSTRNRLLAAKAERDGQYAAACGCLNSLRVMLVQPQLDRQFDAHFRGRFTHQVHRR